RISGIVNTDSLPHDLKLVRGRIDTSRATTFIQLLEVLRKDLEHNPLSGVMELGSNNYEGRIPWSQVYYLNGLLDLIALSLTDSRSARLFQPLIAAAKRRLDLEM